MINFSEFYSYFNKMLEQIEIFQVESQVHDVRTMLIIHIHLRHVVYPSVR